MKITNPIFLQNAGNVGGTSEPYVKMKSTANKLGVVTVSCSGDISIEYKDNGVKKIDTYRDLDEVNLYIRADKGTYAIIKGNITYLYCYGNQLTALDVSGLNSLTYLYCYGNQLTALDVSGLNSLQTLDCSGNQLTALDVSGLNSLTYLDCYGNQLTALDVSGLNSLTYLDCSGNQLTALDVSGLNSLQTLDCYGNQFLNEEDSATTFAESLYTIEEGDSATLKINGTQADAVTEIAEDKGWTVVVI